MTQAQRGYYAVALLMGIPWFLVLLIPQWPREFLLSPRGARFIRWDTATVAIVAILSVALCLWRGWWVAMVASLAGCALAAWPSLRPPELVAPSDAVFVGAPDAGGHAPALCLELMCVASLATGWAARRWIASSSWKSLVAAGVALPFLCAFIFLLLVVASVVAKIPFQAGSTNFYLNGDLFPVVLWGMYAALISAHVVVSAGLATQWAMRRVGNAAFPRSATRAEPAAAC